MWIEKIAWFFFIIYAFAGIIFVSIIFHEYSHFNDFREFNVTNEKLCGLSLPLEWNLTKLMKEPIGYYSYRIYINESNYQEVTKHRQKEKSTEYRAYFISYIIFIFFLYCYWMIISKRYKDEEKILDKEIEILEKETELLEKDYYIRQLESYVLKHARTY